MDGLLDLSVTSSGAPSCRPPLRRRAPVRPSLAGPSLVMHAHNPKNSMSVIYAHHYAHLIDPDFNHPNVDQYTQSQ